MHSQTGRHYAGSCFAATALLAAVCTNVLALTLRSHYSGTSFWIVVVSGWAGCASVAWGSYRLYPRNGSAKVAVLFGAALMSISGGVYGPELIGIAAFEGLPSLKYTLYAPAISFGLFLWALVWFDTY